MHLSLYTLCVFISRKFRQHLPAVLRVHRADVIDRSRVNQPLQQHMLFVYGEQRISAAEISRNENTQSIQR